MEPNLNLWLIPLLPLVGAAVNGLFGRHYANRVVAAAEAAVGLAIIISVFRTRETLNVDRVNLLKL